MPAAPPRPRTVHRCHSCGATSPKWVGRCPSCEEWNTLVEELDVPAPTLASLRTSSGEPPRPITEVDGAASRRRPTGIGELDRVLGGGLVPGSVTVLGGEPGIGKSTLLLQVSASLARRGERVLYASAEESPEQVRSRAARLGALLPSLWLGSEAALPHLLAALDEVQPSLFVVDSIQTAFDPDIGSSPGTVAQVRETAARLVREAKRRGVATVLVGHVTKEGGLAGPRLLEHVVDTVLAFEGERHHALRLLRAVKHRFGPTSELGLFEMGDRGLTGLPDPSGLFLADRRQDVPGSVVVPLLEGQRPLLVEVQALVAPSNLAAPRRSAQGFDPQRLGMLLAVLERRAGLRTSEHDVFVSIVGGVRAVEPGCDLGVALAVVSSLVGRAVPEHLVACGEVGLGGEIRQVAQTPRRLAEAARLGFRRALVPRSATPGKERLWVVRCGSVAEAVAAAGLTG